MESALLLPVLLAVILMMVQPGIVLYDRIVMRDAAAQGARILMTSDGDDGSVEAFIRRRLGAVPQTDTFHVHGPGTCSWEITCMGGASSGEVTVTIGNKLRPLPLIGFGAGLLGALEEDGTLHFDVSVSMPAQDTWVATSGAGSNPAGWIGAWLGE